MKKCKRCGKSPPEVRFRVEIRRGKCTENGVCTRCKNTAKLARRKLRGVCQKCGAKDVVPGKTACPRCSRKESERRRSGRFELRHHVLSHYSGGTPRCACCGTSVWEFLSLDHQNGGGRKHRDELGGNREIYQWVEDNGYPDGFRVLCHNCNLSYGIYGYCPHTEAGEESSPASTKETNEPEIHKQSLAPVVGV